MSAKIPSFKFERLFASQGYLLIAGIDEAGRAPLAGPVTAGAVILDLDLAAIWLKDVRDSKLLSANKREYLEEIIKKQAISYGVGFVSSQEVDQDGIARATRIAMKKAIDMLKPQPDALIIDYFRLPEANLPQKGITGGDGCCLSIACASILAKVARDRLMIEMDRCYPGYGFSHNKGYPTPKHLESIKQLGPCPIHRRSFHPIKPRLGLVYES